MTSLLPDALIFDCDGTIALTADLHFNAFTAAFARHGTQLDRAFYDARGGLARHALIAAWAEETGLDFDAQALIRDSMENARILALTGGAVENPPVAALARAWGKRPSAVASNGEGPVVAATITACGLDGLFDTMVTLDQVSRPKPDPEMFLLAANRLGIPPENCLVLEDSAQGLEAAARANMAALDVRTTHGLAEISRMIALLQQPAQS